MSISDSQNALRAALAARPPRPAFAWPSNERIRRTLREHDRMIVRVLVDEPTGLGLAIRANLGGGWSSTQFRLNTLDQVAFDGKVLSIPPDVEVPA
jgi:hypothetical protein